MSIAIYHRYLNYCQPVQLPAPWRGLEIDSDCLACPAENTRLMDCLRWEFQDDELIASGVMQAGPNGIEMNPALVGSAKSVIALRSAAEEPPFGLITDAGTITGQPSPVLAILRDARTRELLSSTNSPLLLAFSLQDVVMLRALGLPATAACDVPTHSVNALNQLASACGWDGATDVDALVAQTEQPPTELQESAASSVASVEDDVHAAATAHLGPTPDTVTPAASCGTADHPEHAGQELIQLALVNWSPARLTLDEPLECGELVSRLLDSERYLGIDMSHVAVWRPRHEVLGAIRYAIAMDSSDLIQRMLSQSLDDSLFAVQTLATSPTRGSTPFSVALGDLQRCLTSADNCTVERQRAISAFETAVELELVSPLREQALASPDPLERNIGVMVAGMFQSVHLQGPYVGRHHMDHRGGRQNWPTPREYLRLCASLFAYAKERLQ